MHSVQYAVTELDPDVVAAMLAAGEAVLVDVREAHEWSSERIDGAVLHPLSDFDPEDWPSFPGRTTIVTCLAGVRSAKVAKALLAAGHASAIHLRGGLVAWRAAGLPVVTGV